MGFDKELFNKRLENDEINLGQYYTLYILNIEPSGKSGEGFKIVRVKCISIEGSGRHKTLTFREINCITLYEYSSYMNGITWFMRRAV